MIESLDSIGLAEEIDKRAGKCGVVMPVLIEVNIGREAQKGGVMPEELEAFLSALASLANVKPRGLMTIAPVCESAEAYGEYFSEMVRLRDEVFKRCVESEEEPLLSMGMSGSYETAIEEGATVIRVGRALFAK